MILATILAVSTLAAQAPPPAQEFEVSGVAVDAMSARPLPGLRIRIQQAAAPFRFLAEVNSTDAGLFRFVLPEGKYRLMAERRGLPPQLYGAKTLANGFSSTIIVKEGQDLTHLRLNVHRPASIAGAVVDDSGDPVESALVQLLRVGTVGGKPKTQYYGYSYTDDLGKYRFGVLPAGQYYLVVTGAPWYARSLAPDTASIAFAPIFSPAAADAASATPIRVAAGETSVTNFRLRQVPAYRVTISCDTNLPSRSRFNVILPGPNGVDSFFKTQDVYSCGQQVVLPPGRYRVRIVNNEGPSPTAAIEEIEVVASDMEVKLKPALLPVLSGTLTMTGTPLTRSPYIVSVENLPDGLTNTQQAGADGKFIFRGVYPGQYRVRAGGALGYVLKTSSANGAILKENVLTVGNDPITDLSLQLTYERGKIRGIVKRGEATAAGELVVLIPPRGEENPYLIAGFATDSDGSYDFAGRPPGQYKLLVISDLDFAYQDLAALQPLLKQAITVNLPKDGDVEHDFQLPLQ